MSLLSCLIPLSLCNKFVRNIFINKMHVLNKDFIHGSYFFPYIFIPYGSFIYLFMSEKDVLTALNYYVQNVF